ncbi:uncharacterized protein TRAVEDRAFT_47217 [Trametes versicolor FP-101664 SS1]|uniref:uncharacterized protein n=1 Tax=Trametes versicolor (strain FP-101664) TaxID=717944 RepID=UPI0004622B10|nr:uncharacterized protein TRAVEDRAFT_47217 [Trametes versicolor FP-101664 SS1]EIW59919.1 hypothetical protein TRAVEDRAFT_47217 [Trametes versicolor FP-101664 SS1]
MPVSMQHSVNLLPRLYGDKPFYKNMDKYIAAQISCLWDYHVKHDLAQVSQNASQHLTEWAGERIIERATNKDPEAIIDMAIRYLGGCGTMRQSAEGALYVLDSLLDPNCDRDRYMGYLAPPAILAQAHSCAANAHFIKLTASAVQVADMLVDERRFQRPQTAQANSGDPALAYLILAVQHANESARLGLVSPIVLKVGLTARETGANLGVDMAQMGRSRYMRHLWRAVTARLEEIYDEERKKQKKVEDNPDGYACAAEGCGIRSEERAALRACAGRCPRDLKPHYCSKECQTKDWSRHKAVCKAGSAGKAPIITDKANALTFFQLVEEEDEENNVDAMAECVDKVDAASASKTDTVARTYPDAPPGLTRIIDIPGPNAPWESIQISSNTLEPEAMKALRENISKLTANDAAS